MPYNAIMDDYINQIFNKDVMEVLKKIPDNSIDLIYSDPDYNVGINYTGKTYTMKWDDYINWYCRLISESMRVLKKDGNLFTINYPKQNSHLRVKCLDDTYNVEEYVWVYNTAIGSCKNKFTKAHRTILHATKNGNNKFYKKAVALPYQNQDDKRIKKRIEKGEQGRMPYSWIYCDIVKNVSKEKTQHPCQIPLKLFRLLLDATTIENDLVFIHFGGSGNEIEMAKKLGRNFISCEIHPTYYKNIKKKLYSPDQPEFFNPFNL